MEGTCLGTASLDLKENTRIHFVLVHHITPQQILLILHKVGRILSQPNIRFITKLLWNTRSQSK